MPNKTLSNNIENNQRSSLLLKNIFFSFITKGWSALATLLMVPLTLTCLGTYKNGVWLTVSSLLVWIDQMDIGLGNGLRNILATHMAHNKIKEAQKIVSSTVAMLVCVMIPVALLTSLLIWFTDIYSFLNVDESLLPELRTVLLSATIIVCITFVFKFISNVYMGLQLPAVSNLILSAGQTLALFLTYILLETNHATFQNVVLVNVLSPLAIYIIAYPLTFFLLYPHLRPTISSVNLKSAISIGNVSLRFFWLQIASLIQFMSANILISNFYTPEMVTPYQISYRYMSIILVLFTVICMPFWNATTDAYERGDKEWIRTANRKLNIMTFGIIFCLILMVSCSQWIYGIWIQDKCTVPMTMTVLMAVYILLLVLSMRYSYFLNGIGALRLQMYMTFMSIIYIPVAWVVCSHTNDITYFLLVMCVFNIPGLIINMIQFNKILNNKAVGIWKI